MMSLEEIKEKLREMLTLKRYQHSINVMNACIELAEIYGADGDKAALAGLVHDCARELDKNEALNICGKYGIIPDKIMKNQPELLHGMAGSYLAKDVFGIEFEDVLTAVANHTMGKEGMDTLSSIVFLADYIEAGRDYPGVEEIRKAAKESLSKGIVAGLDNTIAYILKKGALLHPQTVLTRNWALEQLRE